MAVQYYGLAARNFRYSPLIMEAFNELDAEFGTIHVASGNGYTAGIPHDEAAIICYGNLTDSNAGMADHSLAGIGSFYDMFAYDSAGGGEPFTLPGGRTNVGETSPYRVYSYVGLYRDQLASATAAQVAAMITEPAQRCVDENYAAEAAARLEAAAHDSIIALSRRTFQSGIDTRRQRIETNERTLVEYGQCLTRTLTELRRDAAELSILMQQQDSDDGARMADQYEMLKNHPRTTDVRFRGEMIMITTTPDIILHDYDGDRERWLGAFKLEINIANQQVRIINLNTPRGGRQHPHVSGTDPCFGGHEMEFAQLMAEGQLLVLFELLIQYLETYNKQDSWGAYGRFWFDAPDQNPALQEQEAVAV